MNIPFFGLRRRLLTQELFYFVHDGLSRHEPPMTENFFTFLIVKDWRRHAVDLMLVEHFAVFPHINEDESGPVPVGRAQFPHHFCHQLAREAFFRTDVHHGYPSRDGKIRSGFSLLRHDTGPGREAKTDEGYAYQ